MLIITMKALRGKQTQAEIQKQINATTSGLYLHSWCIVPYEMLRSSFFYKIHWKNFFHCTGFFFFFFFLFRPSHGCGLRLLLALPPFLRFLLACVGVDLVPHPAQHVGGGLGGHDERLDHRRRQLAQNSAHRPRHPSLLVLPGGCAVDCQRCVCDPLEMGALQEKTIKEKIIFIGIIQIRLLFFFFLPLSLQCRL